MTPPFALVVSSSCKPGLSQPIAAQHPEPRSTRSILAIPRPASAPIQRWLRCQTQPALGAHRACCGWGVCGAYGEPDQSVALPTSRPSADGGGEKLLQGGLPVIWNTFYLQQTCEGMHEVPGHLRPTGGQFTRKTTSTRAPVALFHPSLTRRVEGFRVDG